MEPDSPKSDLRQEVRFAVVMYGGVSLAIYMNGITQELFNMVRSTAPDREGRKQPLSGTQLVYRKIGQRLGPEGELKDSCDVDDPIRTRFTIDVISGTSAGGINAVYLAKALAKDQRIDRLKQLWLNKGDIKQLINDKKSVRQVGLKAQKPPRSLLSGQFMYKELLAALDGMDETSEGDSHQKPLVDDLDLFVTITDVHGLPVPLKLHDKLVCEKRHRNVLHFRYGSGDTGRPSDEFGKDYNRLLAFAARCTSSFPFAFEPMELRDIDDVLNAPGAQDKLWKKFFPDYLGPSSVCADQQRYDYKARAFVDGGYLDNKPFGHAIDALATQSSEIPVDRKLVYIDPSPEHPETQPAEEDRPNAIVNTASAFSLARYETIREDLQRVLQRNRLIERVESIVSDFQMEEDLRNGGYERKPTRDHSFRTSDLKGMIKKEGIAYGGYHRLKLAKLTDEIAAAITFAVGFDAASDEFLAIRHLVRAWREQNYTAYLPRNGGDPGKATQNEFLLQYDLGYRIRRLDFVLKRIYLFYLLDLDARKLLERRQAPVPETPPECYAFRTELQEIHRQLSEVLVGLRQTREGLQSPGVENPLAAAVASTLDSTKLSISDLREELRHILNEGDDKQRDKEAERLLRDDRRIKEAFSHLAAEIRDLVSTRTIEAAKSCEEILGLGQGEGGPLNWFVPGGRKLVRWLGASGEIEERSRFASTARELARDYYESYDRYDLISFPILYATDVGEELDKVEVVRFSPEDATALEKGRLGAGKLTGTALRNFGAFLERSWRQNDILWGRLDGAERIITTLLPDECHRKAREDLVEEAHRKIIREEVERADLDRVSQLLVDALARTDPADHNDETLRHLVEAEVGSPINPALQATLRASLEDQQLLTFFRDTYEPNRQFNHKDALHSLSRSTRVAGELLEGVADEYQGVRRNYATLFARFGRVFWGLVEVATPRSLGSEFLHYWLYLIYAFEAFLIAAGFIFAEPSVLLVGLAAFGVTMLFQLVTLVLGNYMLGRTRPRTLLIFLVILVLLALFLLNVATSFELRDWISNLIDAG